MLYIHTYIIGHYNPSVRIDLIFHTTYLMCVNLIHNCRALQFKVDSDLKVLEKLFLAILITLSLCQKSTESKSPKNCFYIFLMSGLGLEPWLYV